jgi:hypothetical protein
MKQALAISSDELKFFATKGLNDVANNMIRLDEFRHKHGKI